MKLSILSLAVLVQVSTELQRRDALDDELDTLAAETIFSEQEQFSSEKKPQTNLVSERIRPQAPKDPFEFQLDEVSEKRRTMTVIPPTTTRRPFFIKKKVRVQRPITVSKTEITPPDDTFLAEPPVDKPRGSAPAYVPLESVEDRKDMSQFVSDIVSAPQARGLVGIPDGWNLDKDIDVEFKNLVFRGADTPFAKALRARN